VRDVAGEPPKTTFAYDFARRLKASERGAKIRLPESWLSPAYSAQQQ
jgi:hypothetical protein